MRSDSHRRHSRPRILVRTIVLLLLLVFMAPSIALAQGSGADAAEIRRLSLEAARLYRPGKFSEAAPLVRRVLAVAEKALGPAHP